MIISRYVIRCANVRFVSRKIEGDNYYFFETNGPAKSSFKEYPEFSIVG
jgi:hypothetical protein